MSKLAEYLALIPKGFKNIDKVLEGIVNQVKLEFGTLPQEEQEIIMGRRAICASCPFMSLNAKKLGFYTTDREDEHCTQCGCPIGTRTASLESNCGLETYNEANPETKLPLKWEKTK